MSKKTKKKLPHIRVIQRKIDRGLKRWISPYEFARMRERAMERGDDKPMQAEIIPIPLPYAKVSAFIRLVGGSWTVISEESNLVSLSDKPWEGRLLGKYSRDIGRFVNTYLVVGGYLTEEEATKWSEWYRKARDREHERDHIENLKSEARRAGFKLVKAGSR
jgi:hypothetical protein